MEPGHRGRLEGSWLEKEAIPSRLEGSLFEKDPVLRGFPYLFAAVVVRFHPLHKPRPSRFPPHVSRPAGCFCPVFLRKRAVSQVEPFVKPAVPHNGWFPDRPGRCAKAAPRLPQDPGIRPPPGFVQARPLPFFPARRQEPRPKTLR